MYGGYRPTRASVHAEFVVVVRDDDPVITHRLDRLDNGTCVEDVADFGGVTCRLRVEIGPLWSRPLIGSHGGLVMNVPRLP